MGFGVHRKQQILGDYQLQYDHLKYTCKQKLCVYKTPIQMRFDKVIVSIT